MSRWHCTATLLTTMSLAAWPSLAQIVVREPASKGSINIEAHNKEQLAKGFSFSMRPDLSQLEGAALEEQLSRLKLKSKSGTPLMSFSVDKAHEMIVGTTVDKAKVAINLIRNTDKGTELIIGARDADGTFRALSSEQVGVFTLKGSHLGFSMQRFEHATGHHAYFVILVDRSGSMKSVMAAVRDAARSFMAALPKNARCRVISFNHAFIHHSSGFDACNPKQHHIDQITAGGGTDIYTPLVAAYDELRPASDSLRAVLVITDGVGSSRLTKAQVLSRKSAPTHVYWLGDYRDGGERHLAGIADTFILGEQNLKAMLQNYFKQMSEQLKHQYVITIPKKPSN